MVRGMLVYISVSGVLVVTRSFSMCPPVFPIHGYVTNV